MRRALVVAVTLWWVIGSLPACGEDEILARAREDAAAGGASGQHGEGVPDEPAPAPPGTPQPGEVGGPAVGVVGEPTPGEAGAPVPGDPNVPPPGEVGAQAPGVPEQPKPGIPAQPTPGDPSQAMPISGPTVMIDGKVTYDGYRVGSIRVDAFDGDHSKHGTQPGIVATTTIDAPGNFKLVVPLGAGKVYIEASIDEDGDGKPGPQDPQGRAERYPLTVGNQPVEGVRIVLAKQPPPPGGSKDKGRGADF